MKRDYNIFYLLLTLLAMTACYEDRWDQGEQLPGDGKIRFQGVNAQQVVVKTRSADRKGSFPEGTLYRIWAYGDETGGENRKLRFDACGVDTKNGNNRLIVMPDTIDLSFKNAGQDIIDFYGLTDPSANHTADKNAYLKAEATDRPIYELKYGEQDTISDLRYAYKLDNRSDNTSYVIPLEFRHILSKVTFEVVQQAHEENNSEGKFGDITLESIQVLDRPSSGKFDIKKGAFTGLSINKDFTLSQSTQNPAIGTVPSSAGSILLFPFMENEIDTLQVRITLKGKQNTFDDFLQQPGYDVDEEGARLTVTCPVYDSYKVEGGNPVPLRLKPNYRYVLQFMIMGHNVHIVTVVPRVYEWLDGETDNYDEDGGYEEQDLGQPVTFGGVMWSDRNLGANSAHPLYDVPEWRESIGYFYQFNRNIPYFPNNYVNKHIDLNTPLDSAFQEDAKKEEFRILYPVVNFKAWDYTSFEGIPKDWNPLAVNDHPIKPISGKRHSSFVYTIGGKEEETKPTYEPELGLKHPFIRFGINTSYNGKQGKDVPEIKFPGYRGLWQSGDQPCPKGWSIPTEEQFKSIIPTSGYAGNITFRRYENPKGQDDGGWEAATGDGWRQCREHNFPVMFKEEGEGLLYKPLGAGEPMKDANGKEKAYFGKFPCLFREEKDDPQKGARSQYVLSMYGDDWTRVQDASGNLNEADKNENYVYNWGVIYGIKNQGTPKAYRVKWEVKVVGPPIMEVPLSEAAKYFCEDDTTTMYEGKTALRYAHLYCYLVISRYPATVNDEFKPDADGSYQWVAENREWWSNPSEVLYLPIGGVVSGMSGWRAGSLYNIGTEVRYGLVNESEKKYTLNGKEYEGAYMRCVWLKIAGSSTASLGLFLENTYTANLITIRPVRN